MKALPITSLIVLCLVIAGHAQSLQDEVKAFHGRMFEAARRSVEMEGSTNVFAKLREQLVSMGITNITEEAMRQDPSLFSKRFMGIMFEAGTGTNSYAALRTNLIAKGFTNITEEDLREDPALGFIGQFMVHATLPRSPLEWPPPDTNRMDSVREFVEQNGWNMGLRSLHHLFMPFGAKRITGLPWPAIADQSFVAYTTNQWLVVSIESPTSFGWSHSGLLWTPMTNSPPLPGYLSSFKVRSKPLGGGWHGFEYQDAAVESADPR
jgi:hypothetical protein